MAASPKRIVLVYNAEDGLFNALNDWAHKLFSPATYECSLCRFTFGLDGMRLPWKKFIESLKYPAVFLHRPEFRREFPHLAIPLPVILGDLGAEQKSSSRQRKSRRQAASKD